MLGPDRIHLEVHPEVSEPDFSFGTEIDGTVVPAFNTRRASTRVELADGESFAIAGLLSESLRELSGQYPLLGSIPVSSCARFERTSVPVFHISVPSIVLISLLLRRSPARLTLRISLPDETSS